MSRVTFKVDTDRLNHDADCLLESVRRIMIDIEDVNAGINELSAMWRGEANTALVENFNNSHQMMLRILSSFEGFANSLEEDKNNYNICEASVRELVNGI